jgi:hypothetical protein
MVTALSSLTTLMVAQTFVDVSEGIYANGDPSLAPPPVEEGLLSQTEMFSIGISAQSWMTGFLIGKISSGSFATGFRYGIMLLAISMGATIMTQEFDISPSTFLSSPPTSLPGS